MQSLGAKLLELPSTDGKRGLGTFDPARYLLSYTASSTDQANDDDGQPLSSKADDESLARNDQLTNSLSCHLRFDRAVTP